MSIIKCGIFSHFFFHALRDAALRIFPPQLPLGFHPECRIDLIGLMWYYITYILTHVKILFMMLAL